MSSIISHILECSPDSLKNYSKHGNESMNKIHYEYSLNRTDITSSNLQDAKKQYLNFIAFCLSIVWCSNLFCLDLNFVNSEMFRIRNFGIAVPCRCYWNLTISVRSTLRINLRAYPNFYS